MTSLVIFDFDGTLVDTHESIEQSIKLTFEALLPAHLPPRADIHSLISSGTGLSDTFRSLHPNIEAYTAAADEWTAKYREVYATHGQKLIKAFPGAQNLLQTLKESGILMSIVSNKGVGAVKTALERNSMGGYVPEDLIIGDSTPGAKKKPDPANFTDILMPTLKSRYGITDLDVSKVLVIGDTVADIQFAKNIGCRACWCQYGFGDQDACQKMGPDMVVGSLDEVASYVRSSA
ncbi:Phosphoglycolate phosphatase [Trichophyton interdigitale]|uniref:Phosphoglycolate phosphatase n=1 Tax=Trichophyton interdigitale TaxID=101480 RepID=A0A9P4YDQ1_9EURO|nr:Phosphoglycolate phosphatase [Trichophyton interdigitale]KAG5205183.1 Phosphoglycolate phosphatase [Trichophyton interdigitale]KAG8205646.1 Phosphoglycolate phosphatase [Trichophyton interdigitale]